MTDKRTPEELPLWLYEAKPDAVMKRDAWRELVAADKARIAPLAAEHGTLGAKIVAKTIVTGAAGNPTGRVPRTGVTHEEVDSLTARRIQLEAEMRPNPAIRRSEEELRQLSYAAAEEIDVRAWSARAVRTAHERIKSSLSELRDAFRERDEADATWMRHTKRGGSVTVGRTSYDLRAFEIAEVEQFRSGALTDGLDEADQ
ncbi:MULTISPECIES: hypothetical protein [unclassified Curtobacterium]|uniref:hypothetical protein n=1 Tax=unclassified Curtobacterium TaxID=257496 RepID=UPI0008DD9CE0|nr:MULTISPECIES: hypothetical protein [unclassified Curtobacterium]OIH98357.1 hypothetical protein BIU92_14015 [Curtobacterium sp. MCBA15_003]OII32560.1 hypothetical protein BIU94_04460 [Curtobacterium sp. MMLR14_006]